MYDIAWEGVYDTLAPLSSNRFRSSKKLKIPALVFIWIRKLHDQRELPGYFRNPVHVHMPVVVTVIRMIDGILETFGKANDVNLKELSIELPRDPSQPIINPLRIGSEFNPANLSMTYFKINYATADDSGLRRQRVS